MSDGEGVLTHVAGTVQAVEFEAVVGLRGPVKGRAKGGEVVANATCPDVTNAQEHDGTCWGHEVVTGTDCD